MSTSIITAPALSPGASRPPRLQILTLVIASAAAVTAVFAIATDDAGTTGGVAVKDSVASQPAARVAPAPLVAVDPNVDACGRPILAGRLACR